MSANLRQEDTSARSTYLVVKERGEGGDDTAAEGIFASLGSLGGRRGGSGGSQTSSGGGEEEGSSELHCGIEESLEDVRRQEVGWGGKDLFVQSSLYAFFPALPGSAGECRPL